MSKQTRMERLVAENIAAESARRRYTQTALAEKIGLHRVAVSQRFNGHVPWKVNELQRVAQLFGMEPRQLVEDEGEHQS